ncbi:90s preribosome component rrp12 [Stemphylium lycopersici]|nr:90s preribosome component rrp12 [Stemphylium lycopersici]
MPSWRPLPRIAFAICIYPFQPSSPADLPLEIGDELYIIEQGGQDGSWYRGYLVAPPSLLAGLTSVKGQTLEARVFSGIFPRTCVEVREVLGEGKDTATHDAGNETGRGTNYPHATNGIVTPTESTRTTSPFAKASAPHARRGSKGDAVSALPCPGARPLSSRKSTRKRAGSTHSQWTAREDHLQQLMLPLSPISDPTAPRPPAPVPMLKIGDETPTSVQEPLVDEIASCLREWHSTKVHELLLARKYGSLDKMSRLVNRLDTARRQLLHKVLTAKELEKVREATVWDLVAGNKMLCGDVIVRSPSQRGRILTGDDSAIEVTKLQSMMSLLESRPTPQVDEHNLHHLFVSLKHVAGDVVPGAAQISMHLCLKAPGAAPQPLSEAYSFDLTGKDGAAVALAGDKLRSLLVDLSLTDIGEGAGSGSTLYLVFRLLTNEPIRANSATEKTGTSRDPTPSKATGVQPSQQGSVKGGRRSVMFGGSKRKESTSRNTESRNTDSSDERRRPSLEQSRSQTADARPGSAATATTRARALSRDQKMIKRSVAVGVVAVNQVLQSRSEADRTVSMYCTAAPGEDVSEEDGGWDSILPEVYPSASGKYKQNAPISRITIHLKAFVHADAEGLIEKIPTMLHNIKQCRKIGFSGAPTKPRSDIYLTLVEPFLPKNAFLAHPKTGTVPLVQSSPMSNLQLTIEVRKSSGERIEGCIYPSANSAGHTAWRTTAAQRGEGWNSTIRLAIDPQDVPGSHLVMSVADAPGFPFALCWMPLWNQDAFARDGDHALTLYKYDEYTSGMIAGKGAYLGLPWSAKKKDEHVMGPMAAVHVKTFLCSTRYSQDPTILGLIKWQEQPPGELVGLLRRFNFVPEIEIVKLLSEVFDALFAIQSHYAGSDEYEDLVFSAIVIVLGIVHDRRFNLEPLVDQYARTKVFHSLVTSCLMQSIGRLLAKPTDPESSRRLRAAFKVGKLIMKFLVNAREKQKAKEESIGIKDRTQFSKEMKALFGSLEALMKNTSPVLIGTKTILVQNLHSWLSELDGCMPATEVFKLTAGFIGSCSEVQGKLILYKLVLIHHLSELEIFRAPDVRRMLLASTVQWLAPYWGRVDTVTDQWKDQVRLCCSVVASQVEELGKEAPEYMPKLVDSYRAIQATPRPAKNTLSLLFPTSYPFQSRAATAEAPFDEAMAEISAVLAAMSSLPSLLHPEWPKEETAEFLFSVLQVYISILDCEAYPSSWLSVHIYHHKATMRALEKLFNILSDSFLPLPDEADSFSTELWRAFFDALLKLVGSDALALETFPEQKRRAVWKIAGDVREHGADLLQRSWDTIGWEASAEDKAQYGLEKMGGFQVQYVPGLVAPIVELCLSVHEGLRSVAIEVLQTMIISEWTLSEDLTLIQAEMIDCLDNLFKTKHLTEAVLQKHFIQELIELFEPLAHDSEEPLLAALKTLISTVDELLDLLVAVHSTEATGEVFHIMDTLHLMEFLKDMQKEDMYIRYVHQLVELQADAGNYTEAGLALRLHAELYDWDPNSTVDPLTDPSMPPQPAFERKEQLYFQMIDHYENGQSWDNALAAYSELAAQYEHNVFDFAKLARTQHAMAEIHESIAKGDRSNPRYFRVVYRGLGFPPGLRDKQFIFEGSPNDRLASFTDRMQQQHPSAHIINPGAEFDVEGQYLQIYPVSPQKDLTHPIYQRAKVSQSVKDYYLLSRPSHFTSASRRSPSGVTARDAAAEKSLYTTAESFPTILRRSEIIAVGTVSLTPLQMAIERTSRKTVELLAIEKRITDGDDTTFNTLTQELMYAVDTNIRDCVANYHDLLPPPDDGEEDDDNDDTQQANPLVNAMRVALIDYALVIRRCLSLYVRPAQQATKADLSQRFESAFFRELSILLPPNMAPMTRSSTGSWLPAATSRSQVVSPTPDERQVNGDRMTSPVQNGRASRQDKKRLSLAFLTKEFLMGESEKEKEKEAKAEKAPTDDDASTTVSSRSRSKDAQHRNRISLSFLNHTPSSPQPEALPSFPNQTQAAKSDSSLHRQPSQKRPETIKSQKSDKSLSSRTDSVKKRLSFMNISKKSSKSSVRGRVDDTLTHVLLSAIEDTLRQQKSEFTPTAYFAALLSLLARQITAQGIANKDTATATIYLLDLVTPNVPAPLLRSKFTDILTNLAPALTAQDADAPLIRSSIGCLESLLVVQDARAWELPQTTISPRRAVAGLLQIAVDPRPKVRKRAQEALKKVLANPPPSPALDHPAADMCAETAQKMLKEIAAEAAARARKHKGKKDADNKDPDLIHALQLIKTIATSSGGWPSNKIDVLCELLLNISKSTNEFLTMAAFDIFEVIFAGMADELASAKLPRLLEVISELQPSKNDSQLLPPWIAVVSRGYEVSAQIEPDETFLKLPELFSTMAEFLTSSSHNIRISASECLISFLVNLIPESVILEPSIFDEKTLEKVAKIAQDLLSVKYQAAWMEVFNVFAAMFETLRWRSDPMLKPVLRVVGDLRGNDSFAGKKEADAVISKAISAMGPDVVLEILPLNLPRPPPGQTGRVWMLPLLRDSVHNTKLTHFRAEMVPLSEELYQKVIDHGEKEKTMEIKVFETVVQQIWSILPGYCDLPLDLVEAFDQSFCEMLANLLYGQADLRTDVCRALQNLVDSNKAIVELESEDDLLAQARISKADAQKNLDHLAGFASNMLAVLFNVYSQTLPQYRGTILRTINAYLSIVPERELMETFERVATNLEASLPEPGSQTQAAKQKQEVGPNKMPPMSHTLMDLIITIALYLPRDSYRSLFRMAEIMINRENEPQLQKKAYKLIPRLAESEMGRAALKDRNGELQQLLLGSAEKASAPARRDRLNALFQVLESLPQSDLHFIPSILSEVVISAKETNEKAREAAYNLLVAMGEKMAEGGQVVQAKVPNMPADAPTVEASLEEYFTMVSAGLAATTPHMISASITAVTRILYQFHDRISKDTITNLCDLMDIFLQNPNREIVRSVLGFVKVEVITLPESLVRPRLESLLKNLMVWSHEHKAHFKAKVKHIVERMVRKFGVEEVERATPMEDRKLITNIRKTREQRKKKKQQAAEDGEEPTEKRKGKFESEYDQAVYGSESEESEGDSEDEFVKSQSKQQRGGAKGGNTYIIEDEDEPLDLLSKRALGNISSTKPLRQRKQPTKMNARTNEDGKLIIGDSDGETEVKGKKSKKQAAGDEDALMDIDDQNTSLEAGINAYVDAIRGRDAAQTGQKGRLKFSNKRTHEDDEMDMDDDGAEADWQEIRKAKSGSGMGRGGVKSGGAGQKNQRRALGQERLKGGNVSGGEGRGGPKGRIEKTKSPRGRGGGGFRGRGGPSGKWSGPK